MSIMPTTIPMHTTPEMTLLFFPLEKDSDFTFDFILLSTQDKVFNHSSTPAIAGQANSNCIDYDGKHLTLPSVSNPPPDN